MAQFAIDTLYDTDVYFSQNHVQFIRFRDWRYDSYSSEDEPYCNPYIANRLIDDIYKVDDYELQKGEKYMVARVSHIENRKTYESGLTVSFIKAFQDNGRDIVVAVSRINDFNHFKKEHKVYRFFTDKTLTRSNMDEPLTVFYDKVRKNGVMAWSDFEKNSSQIMEEVTKLIAQKEFKHVNFVNI